MPKSRKPLFNRGTIPLTVRSSSQRLQMAARAAPQPALEVVRAGTFAAQHPAVRVEQQFGRPVRHFTCQDAQTARQPLVACQWTCTATNPRAAAVSGLSGPIWSSDSGHRHDLPPAVEPGGQVVDQLAQQRQPVEPMPPR